MEVGDRLNPQRSYRKGFALKGLCQHIIKTNNPSTIEPGELLTIRFPDLKENQAIIPSTTKLTFNITLYNNRLHGSGRQLENTSEGIRLQITKRLSQLVNCLAICTYFRMLKLTLVMLSF